MKRDAWNQPDTPPLLLAFVPATFGRFYFVRWELDPRPTMIEFQNNPRSVVGRVGSVGLLIEIPRRSQTCVNWFGCQPLVLDPIRWE